jgi:hypothetical protein
MFLPLKNLDCGFESQSVDGRLSAFLLFFRCLVYLATLDGLIPAQGVLLTVYKIHSFRISSEWEQAIQPNPSSFKSVTRRNVQETEERIMRTKDEWD